MASFLRTDRLELGKHTQLWALKVLGSNRLKNILTNKLVYCLELYNTYLGPPHF
jgi:hypothetical protein